MCPKEIWNKSKGFSLIEFILTVTIISTIGILSSGFYSNFLLQTSVGNTQDQIIDQLRKAQSYAISGKQGSDWGVHLENHILTLYRGNIFTSRNTSFDETFDINSNLTITNFNDVVFTKTTGLPSTTGTITISGAGKNRTIIINSQGVVTR